jgi:pimeloyl-ACP methyl ester carboxylesterase
MPTYQGDDGAVLHYDVIGADSAPPLIVLAGGAARPPGYLGDLAGLSEHHLLVIPHLRGVGRSGDAELGDRGSWWRQAVDIDGLRASLGLDRCTVVAHSAGTRVAIAHAAQFPGRLAALVLITPPVAELFPHGRAAVIERCGHMPWVEQPAAFRQALDPFLANLDGPQASRT